MTKNKKAEEIAFSRCDVPERTKRFALKYVSEAYAGIKNCRECEFYNTCDRIDSVRAELRKKKKKGMKNMTEQETRGKIFNIIREFNVKKRRYSTHTEPSDDDELADALIAAGVVDKSDYASMKETAVRYKAEVSKAEAKAKEAEHRAEVAEIALDKAVELAYEFRTEADTLSCSSCPMFHIFDSCKERGLYQDCSKQWKEELIKQAEKELAEERKDD